MSETGFMLFRHIMGKTETVLYAACMAFLFYPFMAGQKEQRKNVLKKAATVFGAYVLVYLICDAAALPGWLRMIIVIVLLTSSHRITGMEKNIAFLLGVLFFGIRDMCRLITESLRYIFDTKLLRGVYNESTMYRNTAVGYSLSIVLQFLLLFIMLLFISRRLQKEPLELHAKELCYLCLMPIAGILFGNIIFRQLFIVKENVFFLLYEEFPVFIGLVPLTSFLFYVGIVATVMSYQEMVRLQEEKKKYFVEEQQLLAIRERMEEVEQFYDGIRRMKHEMKNHLTNIKGLAGSGSYEEMEQYIAKMDESLNVFELTIRTGNAVTDVIVNDKQKAADKQGIKFSSEFLYPASDGYDAYDIAIIINNLLQNALEACERMKGGKRYISLSGRQKKRFFLICVKNSFEGEVAFDKNSNLPVSTKGADLLGKRVSMHGIGLSNVKRETAKYLGNVDIRIKKKEFVVTVLLQERSRNGQHNQCKLHDKDVQQLFEELRSKGQRTDKNRIL